MASIHPKFSLILALFTLTATLGYFLPNLQDESDSLDSNTNLQLHGLVLQSRFSLQ